MFVAGRALMVVGFGSGLFTAGLLGNSWGDLLLFVGFLFQGLLLVTAVFVGGVRLCSHRLGTL